MCVGTCDSVLENDLSCCRTLDQMEDDGELENVSRALKTLTDFVEGRKKSVAAASGSPSPSNVPESILRDINFDALEGALNIKFKDRGWLLEAITHTPTPLSGVSSYQRLEALGDAILGHLIMKHLFDTYPDLPPGRLTDLKAAVVGNEYFAWVAVKHNLHLHLRNVPSEVEKQIGDFAREIQDESSKPGFSPFGLWDCKYPKVLSDIVESIAAAIFLDNGHDTAAVWRVFQPLLHPMVTPKTLPMNPIRELQERCQGRAEAFEYNTTYNGKLATVEVFVDGVQVGIAQNPQTKMAQKLAARNALVTLKEREETAAVEEEKGCEEGKKENGSSQILIKKTLNEICARRNWPMPLYGCVDESGPAHAKRFTSSVRVNIPDRGWTDEFVGEPMPSVKKAEESAAGLLLEHVNTWDT